MRNWKAILGAVAVFVLGMMAGALVMGRVANQRMQRVLRGEPVFSAEQITRHLARRLDLDAAQRAEVAAIVARAQQSVRAARQASEPAVRDAIQEAVNEVRAVLRPEQQEAFTRLVARQFLKSAD